MRGSQAVSHAEPTGVKCCAARRVAAIVLVVAFMFHWIPNYWRHHVGGLFTSFGEPWPYYLSLLSLGLILAVWAPRTFGLAWARTWTHRKVALVVGGGMTVTAITGMLFVRVPFHGGSVAIYLCVPLAEELLFRGFLFAVVADAFPRTWRFGRWRVGAATLVTSLAFGLWHLGGFHLPADGFIVFQVIYTTIAGLLFAFMREQTGSIWAPWLVHFVVNWWSVEVPGFWGQWSAG